MDGVVVLPYRRLVGEVVAPPAVKAHEVKAIWLSGIDASTGVSSSERPAASGRCTAGSVGFRSPTKIGAASM